MSLKLTNQKVGNSINFPYELIQTHRTKTETVDKAEKLSGFPKTVFRKENGKLSCVFLLSGIFLQTGV
jgi:hypothetical protein